MKQITVLLPLLLALTINTAYDTTILSQCSANCAPNCGICNITTGACSKCQQGYTLSSANGTCSVNPCFIANCDRCNSDGTVCLKCSDPYSIFIASTSTCFQVCPISNCAKCLADSTSCLLCNSGYSLYSINNKCITAPIANCLVVYDFEKVEYLCTLCVAGFKPSADQTLCIPDTCANITDCVSCPSLPACSQCRDGYTFNNVSCVRNPCNINNCLYCDASAVCLRCQSSYALTANQCLVRNCTQIANCASCKAGSMFCDACSPTFSYNIWTKRCDIVTLRSQPINCQLYQTFPVSGLFACVKCLPTYVFSNANQITCYQHCTANCFNCTDLTVCAVCNPGYSLINGSCVKNVCSNTNSCSLCTPNNTCLQCTDPYSIYNIDSRTCMEYCLLNNCKKCKVKSNICEQCNSGYAVYSWNGQCVISNIANCLVLHDWRFQQFQCTRCAIGFKPSQDQTQCIVSFCASIRDCEICIDPSICNKCRPGYAFEGTQCVRMSCNVQNCLYCNEQGVCLRPTSNYTILGEGKLQSIECKLKDCSACKQGSMFCDSCASGKAFNVWSNACDLDGPATGPNLKYLWLLSIGAVIIVAVIVLIWVYRKGKNAQSSNRVAPKNEDIVLVPDTNLGHQKDTLDPMNNYETAVHFKSPHRNKLPPIKKLQQASPFQPSEDIIFQTPTPVIYEKQNEP